MTSFNIVCPRPDDLYDYTDHEDIPSVISVEREILTSILPTNSFSYSGNSSLKDKFKMKFTKMYNSIAKVMRYLLSNPTPQPLTN